MVWFKVDDGFHSHPKVFTAGVAAVGLWVIAGTWSSANLTDGFVPDFVLPRLGPNGPSLAKKLVSCGLWVRVEDGYRFHDWADYQPSAEQVRSVRAKAVRRSAMHRDTVLLDAVRARDGDICRYCGRIVNWADRRSSDGGTYDHIDAAGPNEISNLAVACRGCNTRKGDRTPAQAGMVLRPPRNESGLKTDRERIENVSEPVPDPTRPEKKKDSLRSSPSHPGASAEAIEEGFTAFYAAYPKRVGRKAAAEKWRKALKDGADAEVMIAGAKRYAEERRGENPRYTKHPSTWLNQECWKDEAAPVPRTNREASIEWLMNDPEATSGVPQLPQAGRDHRSSTE